MDEAQSDFDGLITLFKKKLGWFKETFLVQSDFLSFICHVGETPPS